VSDQDFFFDEDETTVAETTKATSKPAGKATTGRSGAAKAASATKAVSAPAGGSQVSLMVAVLMTVVGLLLGVIIGFILPGGGSSSTPASTTAPAAMDSGSVAPQLTEDQLNSGEMPPGHPAVSGMDGSSETSETTTTGQ